MFRVQIENLAPRFLLSDRNGFALAKAIEAGLNAMNRAVEDGINCLSAIDSMPEWRLDEMAWEFAADWYDPTASLEEKRRLIAGVFEFYNRLGTVYAVRTAVEASFGSGRVEEWFQYNGTPYHYRIFADGTSVSASELQKLQRMVAKVQNVRSILDQICFSGRSETAAVIHMGAAATGALGEIHVFAGEE